MRDLQDVLSPPPLHTPCLSRCSIRVTPEHFEVEEIPTYEPSGDGQHLFLWIEKRDLTTRDLIRHIAKRLNISDRDVGCAGQKDRHAVTRQYLSVPAECESDLERVPTDAIHVLNHARHGNKLRTGHLRGNRFRIVLTQPDGEWSKQDRQCLDTQISQLSADGFANYFGPQRFGHYAATLTQGLELLNHGTDAPRRIKRMQPWLKRLALSAAQSAVFNCVTASRVRSATVHDVAQGDVVIRKGGARPFLYDHSETAESDSCPGEQPILVPAGPMPGPEMTAAAERVAEDEFAALRSFGLTESSFVPFRKLCRGTRRPMLAFPESVSIEETQDGQPRLAFELPSGTYATTLLREIANDVHDATEQTQRRPT
jgi:tRNA pseudouridine13 synthase